MLIVSVSGSVEDETAPQAALHPRGVPTFSPSRPGRPADLDPHREALFLICHPGDDDDIN